MNSPEPEILGSLMYEKIGNITRLYYVLLAVLLFCAGLVLMMAFFLMITLVLALAIWAWAGFFLYLAAIRRPYSDFVASLRWRRVPSLK